MIKGKKEKQYKNEETDNEGKLVFLKMERNYGEFARSFQLPENLDKSSISAKFEDGILNIKINKKEPEKPKETVVNID
jgi:HSP20 family protein